MPALPTPIAEALAERLGTSILSQRPLGGGMVNTAVRVQTADGPLFVKWKEGAPPRFFALEADGLERLRASATLRVPRVVACADVPESPVAYLALEWIEERLPTSSERFRDRFAAGLAALHGCPPPDGCFGLDVGNFLGSQPQANTPAASWAEFYRDRRVAVQIDRALRKGLLPAARDAALGRLLERFGDILAELEARPVLIHGDLWSGNFLATGDDTVLIDPAVYYAEREVEIAFVELFGGFPSGFVDAYRSAYPLQPGYEYRRPLHQLYPLLVHLNHFGETYGPPIDAVCRRYGAL